MHHRSKLLALAASAAALGVGTQAGAAELVLGDVTTGLSAGGEDLLIDAASTGGGDLIRNDSQGFGLWGGTNPDLNRAFDFDGDLSNGATLASSPGTLEVTGFGFASNGSATNNTANSLTIQLRWFGPDGVNGGGDDVDSTFATFTKAQPHAGAGEYYVNFDTPLTFGGELAFDQNNLFGVRIQVDDTGGGSGDERIVFKWDNSNGNTNQFAGSKFSFAGNFSPTSVPEPTTALGVAAAGGLLALRRRKSV